jgi:hypothetical protein
VLEALLANLTSSSQISAIPFTAVLNAIVSSPTDQQTISEGDPFEVGEGTTDLAAYLIAIKIHDEVCADVYHIGVAPDHLFFTAMMSLQDTIVFSGTASMTGTSLPRSKYVGRNECQGCKGIINSMFIRRHAPNHS